MLDSAIGPNKMYYPQTLLEEFKYKITKNKVENPINDVLDSSSPDEYVSQSDSEPDSGSDNQIDNDRDNDESNQ